MKSEERHQLEQNDLEVWINNSLDWIRPRFNMILGAIVVLLLGLLLYNRSASNSAIAEQEAWTEFFAAENAQQLQIVVDRYPQSPVAPIALLRAADLTFDKGKDSLLRDRSEAVAALEEAVELFEKTRSNPNATEMLRRRASYGLAVTHETKGAIETAKKEYQNIVTTFSESEEAIRAKVRLEQLESDDAKKFYAQLGNFQREPTPNIDLPDPVGTIPSPPTTGTSGKQGLDKEAVESLLKGQGLEKVNVPPPPPAKKKDDKSEQPNKPASETKPANSSTKAKTDTSSAESPKDQ